MNLKERIMTVSELLKEQDALNAMTIGDKWKTTMTSSAFLCQVLFEGTELIVESGVGYKWWKFEQNQPVDMWNIKIEVIDMLHFLLSSVSLGIHNRRLSVEERAAFEQMYIGSDIAELAADGKPVSGMQIIENGKLNYESYIQLIRTILFLDMIQENGEFIAMAYATLDTLVASIGLTSQEASAIYTAKATLNRIRQSSGYKDGTYVKVTKEGVEDNERLRPIVENFMVDTNVSLNVLAKQVRDEFFKTA